MAHDHSHEDRNSYYLNQLFTIAVCGALGGVTVMLWYSGKLRFLVVERFWLPTLIGGLSLLSLVLIRAIAVWRSVDEPLDASHQHDHDHDHAHCGHDHDHCDHEHEHTHDHTHAHPNVHEHHEHSHAPGADHGHDHGWAPWRYVVLLLPVVLYFLNLPNEGFSAAHGDRVKDIQFDVPVGLDQGDERPFEVGFAELQQASLSPTERENYEGNTVTIIGQYSDVSDTRFTLVRYKMACCARDAVPLNAVIMVDPKADQKIDRDKYRGKWVEVRGRVHFFEKPGSHEFVTALILYPTKDKPIGRFITIMKRPPGNPFLN